MSDSPANLAIHSTELRRKLSRDGSLMLDVKVVARARTAQVSDLMANGVLKLKVKSAPEQGRANDEVLTVLAAFLAVPRRSVEIFAGHTSAQKRVRASAA